MSMNPVGKNIRKIRSVKGLSQSAFGELFDASRSNIAAYEEGRAQPKVELVTLIAKYFNIDFEAMLTQELTVNAIMHFGESKIDQGTGVIEPTQNVQAEKKVQSISDTIVKVEKELARLKKELEELKDLI